MKAEEFGKYLRELRQKRNLTIRQIELMSGVSNAYLSQIENGKRGIPSPEILKKLSQALKVPYEELMAAAGYLDEIEQNNIVAEQKIAEAIADDPELLEFWQDLLKRDDLQLLFKQVRELPPDTIKRIIRYIKIVEDEEANM